MAEPMAEPSAGAAGLEAPAPAEAELRQEV